jgi:quercetin dioxygenase-like cupin family protein
MNDRVRACLITGLCFSAACAGEPDPADSESREPPAATAAFDPAGTPSVLGPNDGEHLSFFDGRYARLKVTREGSGSRDLLMGTEHIPPGTGIPVHSHDGYEEIIFVHEGIPELTLGDSTVRAEPGTTMYIPPGTWHGVAGSGSDSTTILFIFPETDIAEFFRRVGQAEGEAPPQLTAEDWAEIMERHRMRERRD